MQLQTLAGDPEGQPGGRADLHHRPDHQPGAGPPAAGPRLRERAGSSGWWTRHSLPGYPALDILNAANLPVTPAAKPAQVRVYRYRPHSSKNGANPNLGGITALARTIDRRRSSLRAGALGAADPGHVDYYLDPSGLWIALATKLDPERSTSRSATSPATGRRSAAFRPTRQGRRVARDSLQLIALPSRTEIRRPRPPSATRCGRSTGWRAADLDPSSLAGEHHAQPLRAAARPARRPTWPCSACASPRDANRVRPGQPALPPAAGPRGAARSSTSRTSSSRTSSRSPTRPSSRRPSGPTRSTARRCSCFCRRAAGQFALRLQYNATGGGDRAHPQPGHAAAPRGQRAAVRAAAGSWSGGSTTPSPTTSARSPSSTRTRCSATGTARSRRGSRSRASSPWRPRPSSAWPPATRSGERGAINLIGLYQREQSAFNRPPLGFEASANLIGGANTELHFKPNGLTSFLNKHHAAVAPPRRPCSTSTPSSPSPSPTPTGRGRPTSRSSRPRRASRCRCGERPGSSAARRSSRRPGGHRLRRRLRPGRRGGAHLAEPGPERPRAAPSSSGRRTSTR